MGQRGIRSAYQQVEVQMHDPSENEETPDSLTQFESDLNEALEHSTDGVQDEDE